MNSYNSKLFVFHGCDRKVGTTMISHCAARLIAEHFQPARVLFAALNGNDDIHYYRGNSASVEAIKIQVDNRLLTEEDLEAACFRDGPLYLLDGVPGGLRHRNYAAEFSSMFIEKAFEVFDFVVIDSGNELDSGLCVGALKTGGKNIMLLNQNESTLLRYEGSEEIYTAIDASFSCFVINRYMEDDPHDVSYLKSRLIRSSGTPLFTVREEGNYSRLAEMDHQVLLEYRCPGFSEDLRNLVAEMTRSAGFGENALKSQKKKLFHFM